MSDEQSRNGNGNKARIILALVSIIVTLVLFIGFPTLVGYVVANDKESRGRDDSLDDKIVLVQKETNKALSKIEHQQAKMLVHLEYLRAN